MYSELLGSLLLFLLTAHFQPTGCTWKQVENRYSYQNNLDLGSNLFFFDLQADFKFKNGEIPEFKPPDGYFISLFETAAYSALGEELGHSVQVYFVDYKSPSIVSRVSVFGGQLAIEDTIAQGLQLYALYQQYKTDVEDIILEKMSSNSQRFATMQSVTLYQVGGIDLHMREQPVLVVEGFQFYMLTVNTAMLIFSGTMLVLIIVLFAWRFSYKFKIQFRSNNQGEDPPTIRLVFLSMLDTVIDLFVPQKKKQHLVQIERIMYEDLEVAEDNPIATGSQKQVYQVKWNGNIYALVFSKNQKEIREMEIYKHIRYLHENIVQIRGYSQDSAGRQCVLMEFAKEGSLDDFLRKYRQEWINHSQHQLILVKLRIAQQICSGLAYLHKQGVIHRDIAARNVLLFDLDPIKVKLADFGLALITSTPQEGNTEKQTVLNTMRSLPIRWTPPEVIHKLERSRWSQKSDIWSFGILLWEIFTDGKIPFESLSDVAVMQKLGLFASGQLEQDILPCQYDIPDQIYGLMRQCWRIDPSKRPSAKDLLPKLKQLVDLFAKETGNDNSDTTTLQHTRELQLIQQSRIQQQQHNRNKYQRRLSQRMDQRVFRQVVRDVAQLE
eukprot:TRINITY_DN1128_c1_g1_i1.p1 TRINITY_DN1128_c1_g1~~TRINITY_DN1128_c1_g1_i1.p1  ORF type:complete len:609 (-),score=20.77 TRINITY_DN1128_c1_g1_i1:301-2127(-)